jgi:hypothetical protein
MRRTVTIALVLLLSAPAWAGELGGVTMPDQVNVAGKTLRLNGMGVRKKLWISVYVAGLYLESPTHDAGQIVLKNQAKQVRMHFTTGLATKGKMDDAWDEGFEANNPDTIDRLEPRVDTFKGYFGDMKDGDLVEITYVPDQGTTVAINGVVKGTIAGQDFGQAMMRVWFGDHPPTAPLKEGLLGK